MTTTTNNELAQAIEAEAQKAKNIYDKGLANNWDYDSYHHNDLEEAKTEWLESNGISCGYPDRAPEGVYYEDGEICAFTIIAHEDGETFDTIESSFAVRDEKE